MDPTARTQARDLAAGGRDFIRDHLDALSAAVAENRTDRALALLKALEANLSGTLRAEAGRLTRDALGGDLPDEPPAPADALPEIGRYLEGDPRVRAAWAWRVLENRLSEAEGVLLHARLEVNAARAATPRRVHEAERRAGTALGNVLGALEAWAHALGAPVDGPPTGRESLHRARAALATGAPEAVPRLLRAALSASGRPDARALADALPSPGATDTVLAWGLLDLAEAALNPMPPRPPGFR